MRRTRFWVAAIAGGLILSVAAALLLLPRGGEGTVALVRQDGEVLYEIDLAAVEDPYTLTVESPGGGVNTIAVEPGRIRVIEANCPDQVCVKRGWIGSSDSALPVACLPHGLIIELVGETDGPDGVAG